MSWKKKTIFHTQVGNSKCLLERSKQVLGPRDVLLKGEARRFNFNHIVGPACSEITVASKSVAASPLHYNCSEGVDHEKRRAHHRELGSKHTRTCWLYSNQLLATSSMRWLARCGAGSTAMIWHSTTDVFLGVTREPSTCLQNETRNSWQALVTVRGDCYVHLQAEHLLGGTPSFRTPIKAAPATSSWQI